jgi:uncharacterized surface protein with fasciclin (FAS1) repeats
MSPVRRLLAAAALAAPLGFASLAAKAADIVDTAVSAGQFQTLVTAVEAAGLVETLKGEGPFTVFAPTDEAFAKLPKGTVEHLLKPENRDELTAILTYHVVPGRVTADKVVELSSATTANGQRLGVHVEEGGVRIDGANVIETDISASNGVIHVIDQVLIPSTDTIVDIAAGSDQFETLVAAVTAAELAEVLSGEGPFTVFAPTDAAFAKLPAGTVEHLVQPENRDQLVAILKLHVVPGRVYSDQALAAGGAKTLLGRTVHVRATEGGARVGTANLVKTDIEASNGVIHVIDTVLLPE